MIAASPARPRAFRSTAYSRSAPCKLGGNEPCCCSPAACQPAVAAKLYVSPKKEELRGSNRLACDCGGLPNTYDNLTRLIEVDTSAR